MKVMLKVVVSRLGSTGYGRWNECPDWKAGLYKQLIMRTKAD